jgi:hypothetical protein
MADSGNKELGTIECFNPENFHLWKIQMCAVFMGNRRIQSATSVEEGGTGLENAHMRTWTKVTKRRVMG